MDVNKKILEHLRSNGISQGELAEKIDMIPQNLNRLLKSDDIKLSQLEKICKALGVPVVLFVGNEVKNYQREIEDLKLSLDHAQKDWKKLAGQFAKTSDYIDETIDFILNNRKMLDKIKKNSFYAVSISLRENIYCRFEYGYSAKHFVENIVFILENSEKLPLDSGGKEYSKRFKNKP